MFEAFDELDQVYLRAYIAQKTLMDDNLAHAKRVLGTIRQWDHYYASAIPVRIAEYDALIAAGLAVKDEKGIMRITESGEAFAGDRLNPGGHRD